MRPGCSQGTAAPCEPRLRGRPGPPSPERGVRAGLPARTLPFSPCKCFTALPEQRWLLPLLTHTITSLLWDFFFPASVCHLEINLFLENLFFSSPPTIRKGNLCSKPQLRLQIDHSLPDPYLTRMWEDPWGIAGSLSLEPSKKRAS